MSHEHSLTSDEYSAVLARQALDRGAVQKQIELTCLIELLREQTLRAIVEIGTLHGGTLYAWCQLAEPDATIVAINLPVVGGTGYSEDIQKLLGYAREGQKLALIREDSHKDMTLSELKEILDGQMLDLLFIDGDHSYEGVKKDFEMYSPLVGAGGLVVFHDIVEHTFPGCEVEKFWVEVKDGYPHDEFCDPGDVRTWGPWGGIGVIHL